MFKTLTLSGLFGLITGLLLSATLLAQDQTVSLNVQARNGAWLKVTAQDQKFEWKTVSQEGAVSKRTINISEVGFLEFAVKPASEEVARIRELVSALASDDYRTRHAAELELSENGKPFEPVIELARNHREPEVRYRVDRLLKKLQKMDKNNRTNFSLDFDLLRTGTGQVLEGDIGDFSLDVQWNGESFTVNRNTCLQISVSSKIEASIANVERVSEFESTVLSNHMYFFTDEDVLNEGFRTVGFDLGARGENMVSDRDFDVGEVFAYLGCLLSCETHDGRAIISGYRFKQSVSRNRSVGNFYIDPERNKKTSYQGVMRIDFCLPGSPNSAATVNAAGLFAEIVKPRHTIVEAYNSAGHIVGTSQSSVKKAAFMGVASGADIAYLRVTANEYAGLDSLNRDFAVDDLCYTEPKFAPQINFTDSNTILVTFRDLQQILVSNLVFDANSNNINIQLQAGLAGKTETKLSLDNVAWITPPQIRDVTVPESGRYFMLNDGSILHCESGLTTSLDEGLTLDSDSIVGTWAAGSPCRYPQKGDFDLGDTVAVFPLYRIGIDTENFKITNDEFLLDLEACKTVQQGFEDNVGQLQTTATSVEEFKAEDGSLQLANSTATFWTANPPQREAKTGLLRLNDGQQLVLGGTSGFALKGVDGSEITITNGDVELTFQLDEIFALNFPE